MHAQKGHDPPNSSRSTTATVAPRARALYAAASPAGPAPMTTKSNCSSIKGARLRCAPGEVQAAVAADERPGRLVACSLPGDGEAHPGRCLPRHAAPGGTSPGPSSSRGDPLGRARRIVVGIGAIGLIAAAAGTTFWTFIDPSTSGAPFALYIGGIAIC